MSARRPGRRPAAARQGTPGLPRSRCWNAPVTVRNGAAASIFPFVYHDLARWADERGYQTAGPGREVFVHRVNDAAEVSQQVFEIQLPFSRPEATPS